MTINKNLSCSFLKEKHVLTIYEGVAWHFRSKIDESKGVIMGRPGHCVKQVRQKVALRGKELIKNKIYFILI